MLAFARASSWHFGCSLTECEIPRHAEEATMNIRKILIPLDGSPLAEAAIDTALDLLMGARVSLALVRAAEAHTPPGADPTDAQVEVVREAEAYLASVRERLAERGITDVDTSVWYGPAAVAIIESARLKKADLIVMSSHGRSGLGRLILGSVAESVLRGTTVPVCVTRVPGAPLKTPEGTARPGASKARVGA
jgi:nucleotide-binding universal stress UspA family protein